ncbi:hypothetical protein ABII15_20325 [Streptomyces sp. HUAS MG91]|uniref:Secreted protein n=1 Tax=Streptomyces tabacisoli TaxID=3156398 RepID=A0AAU8IU86_9ACTN
MPALPVRRIATSALCASLLIGAAAPVFAADSADERASRTVVSSTAAPDAATLLNQVKTLQDTAGVMTPVTGLLDAVLKTKDGKLPADEAQKHADAVKSAIDTAKEQAAAVPVPKAPDAAVPDDAKAPPAVKDVQAEALTALQAAVDALVKSATSGDVKALPTQAPAVVTGLVNVLAATLLSGALPAPDLPGLPALPQLPAATTPSLPATPSVPQAPAVPQTPALPQAPALPQTPATS